MVGVGAAPTATAASVCCTGAVVAPLIVTLLGASGAAVAAGLKPYSPYLFAASLTILAFAFLIRYRKERQCTIGSGPVRPPWCKRVVRGVLWFSGLRWLASLIFTIVSSDRPRFPVPFECSLAFLRR
jgi:hypothetical protein